MTAPKKRRKKIWIALAVAFVILVVTARLGGSAVSRELLFPVSAEPLAPPRSDLPADWQYEVVTYRTADGVELRGAYAKRSDAPTKPAIVFFHGNAESAEGEQYFGTMLARTLRADVLVAEFRGYGGATGEPTEESLYADGRAAVEATGREPKDVVVAGWSLGTGVAVELAHEGIGRAVVLLAPFTSIPDTAKHLLADPRVLAETESRMGRAGFLAKPMLALGRSPLGAFLIADHFDSGSKIGDLDVPVFVVHGSDDEVVAQSMGRELAKRAKHGTFFDVPGASHGVQFEPVTMEAFEAAIAVP
jgi:pimeloyl-ACP methyl ester carboxylesterase